MLRARLGFQRILNGAERTWHVGVLQKPQMQSSPSKSMSPEASKGASNSSMNTSHDCEC